MSVRGFQKGENMQVYNGFKIAVQVALLYGIYRMGVFIQDSFHLFIPGSIIGMLMLFLLLVIRGRFTRFIKNGCEFFLKHLQLFFLPATVGIISYFNLFRGKGMWLIVISMISTFIVMMASAVSSRLLAKERGKAKG